jgi:sugar lactone lactonase YvrE
VSRLLAIIAALFGLACAVGSAHALAAGFALGDLFVADHGAVFEFRPDGGLVASYTDPSARQFFDLAFDNARTKLYVTDASAHDVKVFDMSGTLEGTFGGSLLAQPRGIAVRPSGDVYVADTGANDIQVFDSAGRYLRTIGPVIVPLNLAFSPDASRLYVSQSDYFAGVRVFDLSNGDRDLGTFGDTASRVGLTTGLAVNPDGTLYVGDSIFGGGTDSIKVFTAEGSFVGTLVGGLSAPIDLTFDASGNLWLTNTNNFGGDQIDAFTPTGTRIASFSGAPLVQPTGLAFFLPVETPAPVANAGPDQIVECAGPTGTTVTLDGSASSGDHLSYEWRSADGTVIGTSSNITLSLSPGSYVFRLTVTDAFGRSSEDSVGVTVADTIAPSLSLSMSRSVLWPPDHTLVGETATITVSDRCDAKPTVSLSSIVSSEPDDGLGDGDRAGDIQGATLGTDDRSFSLRSERSGDGLGRTYRITYSAQDAAGNTKSVATTVSVPHDAPGTP